VIRAGDSVFVFDEAPAGSEPFPFGRLAGASRAMERVVAAIRLLSLSRDAVIIEGERGVGRSLVAEEAASRSGLLPGAWRYVADVGDLARDEQEKLVAEIDAGERRVFASTINPLDDDVGIGRVVPALRDRFARHRIVLPALRARRLDIIPIVRFLVKAATGRAPEPTADFVEPLLVHDWPGSGGELKSVAAWIAERLGDRDALTGDLLPKEFHDRVGLAPETPLEDPVEETEVAPTERELRALLERHRGNVSEVARHYRKDRVQLYRWLKRHNLKVEDFR
jgi:DNA-binding NtrC family response regulator